MKRLCAALLFLGLVLGGPAVALAQHKGHVMALAPAQQMPMPKPKASPAGPERAKPPAKPLAEALQPVKVHFERLKQWAGEVHMDFERLRTIHDLDELRDAMRQHSLMLDQLQMMLIEHEALVNDQMRLPASPAKRDAAETTRPSASPHGAHSVASEEKKP